MTSALTLDDIDKAFDGQPALSDASLHVSWGEVHALLGENGAGKSTLINIACGLYSADAGSITYDGETVTIDKPSDATRLGIGAVHQHFKLVGPFSVAENVLLACGRRLGIKRTSDAAQAAQRAAEQLGFAITPDTRTDTLSIAERQRLEIVKLILLGADVLILDEPTAVLTDAEADGVLTLLRELAGRGKAVVLITHRLREVTDYADRVTVMRQGRTVLAAAAAKGLDRAELARLMVGESITDGETATDTLPASARTRLALDRLTVVRGDGSTAVDNASLKVHRGEIVGIAGVGGNGQTELTEAIFGLCDSRSGELSVDGQPLARQSIRQRRRRGLRLVPADRFNHALLAELRAYENLALTEIGDNRFGPWWWLRRGAMRAAADRVFKARQIVGGTPSSRTRLLSGGNAQKLLLARELNAQTAVLIAHSPTRGLDVRACWAVHQALRDGAASGAACLLISEDLDEVLALSHRIAVMSRGRLHGPWPKAELSRQRIGELMAGHA